MKVVSILIALLGVACAAEAAAPSRIDDIQPLALNDGVNVLRGFLPGGLDAIVVQAWRDNGDAHSYHDWLVLGPEDGHGSAVVALEDPDTKRLQDVIRDAPFDGERVLGTVRFARGRVDGQPAGLLLDAELDEAPSGVLADHVTATVHIYRVEATDGSPGETPFEFRLVSSTQSTKRYCTAVLALAQMQGLPLPKDYAGNRVDGCFNR